MGGATTVSAIDVLVVTSLETTGYDLILSAAQSACNQISIKKVNLATNTHVNLPQLVRNTRAKVVIGFGDKAFKLANATVRVPVIGAMVTDQKNSAVSFVAPPSMYLAAIKKLGWKHVGLIHSAHMKTYALHVVKVARQNGITIIRRVADSPPETIERFSEINGLIDSLWILPDTKAITAGSAEILIRGAQEKDIPVIAFSRNYLKNGSALVIEPDREAIGKAIGERLCAMGEDPFSLENKNLYRVFQNEVVINRLRMSSPS